MKIAIVVSRFNEMITKGLLEACWRELKQHGIKESAVDVVWVPGAFEIPVTALKLASKKNVSMVICLGAVIKGETDHYDLVARQAARGIMDVSLKTGKPIIFEVLACRTFKQASQRSVRGGHNKGRVAAMAALAMLEVMNKVREKE